MWRARGKKRSQRNTTPDLLPSTRLNELMARASPSKKQIILSFCAAKKFQVIRRAEMQAIRQELHRQLGDRGTTSAAYIAQVLQQAGQVVEYEDPYVDSSMPEPYASRLKDALHFHNLASAEASLINLHAAYREYQRANDRAGIAWVQRLLRKGKRRAESLAANPKIRPEKQREKQEIAAWFRVWLQTPDLFFDWLELRKRSEEFQSLFGR